MSCRPTNRASVPTERNPDTPRMVNFRNTLLSPYGVGAPVREKITIPPLLGSLQANPNNVSLPAHGAPNDNRRLVSGIASRYDRSSQAARPMRIQRGVGIADTKPKQPIIVQNF